MAEDSVEILLVEDNPNDAELTIRALNKHNLANDLVWVKDGAEALEFLLPEGDTAARGARKPRLIMLDLRLPKLSGVDVLRKIKSDERTHDIPVVVLTSSRDDGDIATCYDLGVNSYVAKPIDFNEFIQAVADLGLYWLLLNQLPAKA